MKVPAGKLKDRIQVQAPTHTANSIGEKVQTWANAGTPIWGQVLDDLKGEVADAQTVKGQRTVTVLIRTMAARAAVGGGELTTAHRLLVGSRVLNITSIVNSQEHDKALLVRCTEAC